MKVKVFYPLDFALLLRPWRNDSDVRFLGTKPQVGRSGRRHRRGHGWFIAAVAGLVA